MDIQKTMEFILEQNAATAVQLQKISESDVRLRAIAESHEQDLRTHEEDLHTHTEWLTGLSQALQELSGQMKSGFDRLAQAHDRLAQAQRATEESLNILIRTVQDILPRTPNSRTTA